MCSGVPPLHAYAYAATLLANANTLRLLALCRYRSIRARAPAMCSGVPPLRAYAYAATLPFHHTLKPIGNHLIFHLFMRISGIQFNC